MNFIGNLFGRNPDYKGRSAFLEEVEKGDILITTGTEFMGLVGHAAIMATDDWVVEMPGDTDGEGYSASTSSSSSSSSSFSGKSSGDHLKSNNRRIAKDKWYRVHRSHTITVYRCRNSSAARNAADWAYINYYNSSGGERKNIHIDYSVVSPIFALTNPSYCSKLVLQAYYYGGRAMAVMMPVNPTPIVPTTIPTYFMFSNALDIVGTY